MTPPPRGVLTRRDRQSCPPVLFHGRVLDTTDLDAVISLHRLVLAAAPTGTVAAETNEFFAEHILRIGRTLGLFAEGKLIAYGVLGLPDAGAPNFGNMLSLTEEDLHRVAHIDGASVRPKWRGNRLQRVLIAWRLNAAVAAGRSIALSTAAPGNLPSIRNLLAEHMTIRALQERFGGLRYILRRDLDGVPPTVPARGRWVDLADGKAQQCLFDRGEAAWTLDTRETGLCLWFAPPRQT